MGRPSRRFKTMWIRLLVGRKCPCLSEPTSKNNLIRSMFSPKTMQHMQHMQTQAILITTMTGWWLGTLFLFSHMLGILIPTDELLSSSGGSTTNRSYLRTSRRWDPRCLQKWAQAWELKVKSRPQGADCEWIRMGLIIIEIYDPIWYSHGTGTFTFLWAVDMGYKLYR